MLLRTRRPHVSNLLSWCKTPACSTPTNYIRFSHRPNNPRQARSPPRFVYDASCEVHMHMGCWVDWPEFRADTYRQLQARCHGLGPPCRAVTGGRTNNGRHAIDAGAPSPSQFLEPIMGSQSRPVYWRPFVPMSDCVFGALLRCIQALSASGPKATMSASSAIPLLCMTGAWGGPRRFCRDRFTCPSGAMHVTMW